MVKNSIPVDWPEFVQFGNKLKAGPRIPLDSNRAEAIRRKNPKAFQGIEQAKTVYLTTGRYKTPEQCSGLLWCCIEFGLPPHVKYYMEHLTEFSQQEYEAYKALTERNRPAEGYY